MSETVVRGFTGTGFFAGNGGLQAGKGDAAGVGLGSLSGNVCAAGWKAGIERCVCSLSEKTDFYPWRKQEYVTETEDYIAHVKGNRTYPWRILL